MTTEKWSDLAWQTAQPVYNAILELPFLKELSAGTLPAEKFNFYIGQDSLYLNEYSRVLAHIAARSNDAEMTETFLKFAADGIAVERSLHAGFMKERPKEMSPTCLFYTSLLKASSMDELAVECAAVLPCFQVYMEVGKAIYRNARLAGNPYEIWIRTYADESFEISVKRAMAVCDRLAAISPAEVRMRMTQAFLDATRLELRFWDSAYRLETWSDGSIRQISMSD